MAILVDQDTRLLVQGITGHAGEFHAGRMIDYGTQVVAGVAPGKGGQRASEERVPVFDTVAEAMAATEANASIIYVPAPSAPDAILEAADARIPLIVCITEGIPIHDMIRVYAHLTKNQIRLIGPNCPGVLSPGRSNVGIISSHIAIPGPIGVVSRSGTLTYEVVQALTSARIGQATCVGIGGDPIIGTSFVEILGMFEQDPATEQVVLIGEIGGTGEEQAAQFIAEQMTKPVIAFVAGRAAPPGKRMGHAGAVIEGSSGTAAEKIAALEAAGVAIAQHPGQVPDLLK
jgi:succinyl-CoA synthetase alpha subunit